MIPFASFIWFCHEENAYMNSGIRSVGDVARMLEDQTKARPVVLYLGDRWETGQPIDNRGAIKRYAADVATLRTRPRIAGKTIGMTELQQAADRFSERVKNERSPTRLRLSAMKQNVAHQGRIPSDSFLHARLAAFLEVLRLRTRRARIWLTDTDMSVGYCLLCGLFAFKFLWGRETLQINGRFREMYPGRRIPLFDYLGSACTMNRKPSAVARPL